MAEPTKPPAARRTAGELIDVLAAPEDGSDLALLSVTTTAFFDDQATRRRTAQAVAGVRRQLPAAMDSRRGSMLVPTILVVVNGIVGGVLGDGQDESTESQQRLGWLARRRLARRLSRANAVAGSDTPLPVLSAERVARVMAEVRLIARNAGLPEHEVETLCGRLRVALDQAAGRA